MQNSASKIWQSPLSQRLVETLASIADTKTMQKFLGDVMTEKEITEISARLEAARLLQQGAKYQDIIIQTKLSTRTIARISEWLKNGYGGYEAALATMHHHRPKSRLEAV